MKKKFLILIFGLSSILGICSVGCGYKKANSNNEAISKINKEYSVVIGESIKIINKTSEVLDDFNVVKLESPIKSSIVLEEDLVTTITYEDYFHINGFLKIDDICVKIKDGKINYDSSSQTFMKEDFYISKSKENSNIEFGIKVYMLNDERELIFGKQIIDDLNTLNIIRTNKDNNSIQEVKEILEQSFVSKDANSFYLYDLKINPNFTNKLFFTESSLKFSNDLKQEVIIKKYEENFDEDYFNNTITINNIDIKYGDIIDKENNFVFYKMDLETPLLIIAKNDIDINNFFENNK